MILIHGDNTVGSRNFLNQKKRDVEKQGYTEFLLLEGKKIHLGEVKLALETQSLFGNQKYIIIENLLSRPKSKDKTEIEDYLKLENFSNCLLWESKKMTPAQIKKFSGGEVQEFKSSSQTFQFLDSLGSGEHLSSTLLHEALELESEGSLFFMWARQIRILLQSSDSASPLPPWQKQKAAKQFALLGNDKIRFMHKELLNIDEKIKTGNSALGLVGELELLLAKLYDKTYEKV